MSKNETFLDTKSRTVLKEMGFSNQIIDLAIQDTGATNIEALIEAIYQKENKYNKMLKSESKKPTNILVEDAVLVKFGEKPELSKSRSDDRRKQKKDENIMDSNTIVEIYKFISNLNSETSGKEPNVIILKMAELLKSLKFNNSASKDILRYLDSNLYYSQVSDLRNKVFESIQKLMNMRIKRGIQIDMNEFEYIILMSFEMKLLKVNQMDLIMIGFTKFCSKLGYKPDEILMNSLDKLYMEATKMTSTSSVLNPVICPVEEDIKLLEDPVILNCQNVTSVNLNKCEESKMEEIKTLKTRAEKEFCIVCMDKIREIVFLPCCHFLTCPECSIKIGTCPLCTKKVDKNLKIFWS